MNFLDVVFGRCDGPHNIFWTNFYFPSIDEIIYQAGIFLFIPIFWLIDNLYQLFMALGNARLFKQSSIEAFAARVYIVLGIVMLFFVTYQLFRMMISPEKLTGSGEGSGKGLFKSIVTTLIMLVLVNFAFSFAYDIQNAVLSDNVIGKLFFGTTGTTPDNIIVGTDAYKTGGRQVAATIFQVFWHPKSDSSTSGTEAYDNVKLDFFTNNQPPFRYTTYTYGDIIKKLKSTGSDRWEIRDFLDLRCEDIKDEIEWHSLPAFVIGLFCAYVLVVYCLDLGERVVKLGFYQIIAPIPISMRLLPTKKGTFDKWLKDVGSTFATIFIKITVMYFAIYTILLVSETLPNLASLWEGQEDKPNAAIQLFAVGFIIWGIFQFMLKAPKLIGDVFGLSSNGENSLSLNKRLHSPGGKLLGRTLRAPASALGSAALGAASNIKNAQNKYKGRSVGRTIAAGAGGLLGGFNRGLRNGFDPNARLFRTIGDTRRQVVSNRVRREANRQSNEENNISSLRGAVNRATERIGATFDDGQRQINVTHRIEMADSAKGNLENIKNIFANDVGYKKALSDLQAQGLDIKTMDAASLAAQSRLNSSAVYTADGDQKTYQASRKKVSDAEAARDSTKQAYESRNRQYNDDRDRLVNQERSKYEQKERYDREISAAQAAGDTARVTSLTTQRDTEISNIDGQIVKLKAELQAASVDLPSLKTAAETAASEYSRIFSAEATVQAKIVGATGKYHSVEEMATEASQQEQDKKRDEAVVKSASDMHTAMDDVSTREQAKIKSFAADMVHQTQISEGPEGDSSTLFTSSGLTDSTGNVNNVAGGTLQTILQGAFDDTINGNSDSAKKAGEDEKKRQEMANKSNKSNKPPRN